MRKRYRILLFRYSGKYDSTLTLNRAELELLRLHTEEDVVRFTQDKIIAGRKLYMIIMGS